MGPNEWELRSVMSCLGYEGLKLFKRQREINESLVPI